MKELIILITCLFMLIVFSSQAENITNKKEQENLKQVSAKCHVTLIDGSEVITFWRIKPKSLVKLTNKVVGKKVSTQKSVEKIKVYRAFQCVLEDDDFTSLKARKLDENTPR